MKILTTLLFLAATFGALPVLGQMTLPQQRMAEYEHNADSLQRALDAASRAAKNKQNEQNEQSHHVSYMLVALVAGTAWYIRRRRSA